TCATDSTIPNSDRNSSSRQSKATESAPPETAAATRSPARIDCCFRIVFNSRSDSSCTEKWYRNQYPVPSCQYAEATSLGSGNWVLGTAMLFRNCGELHAGLPDFWCWSCSSRHSG